MRFVIQSPIYLVIVAILLHPALAIPLPGPPEPGYQRLPDPPGNEKPGVLKNKVLAVKQKIHGIQAAWHGKKATFSGSNNDNLQNAVEPIFGPNSGIVYDAAVAEAKKRAKHHTDRQQDHLKRKEKCRKKREGEPA